MVLRNMAAETCGTDRLSALPKLKAQRHSTEESLTDCRLRRACAQMRMKVWADHGAAIGQCAKPFVKANIGLRIPTHSRFQFQCAGRLGRSANGLS